MEDTTKALITLAIGTTIVIGMMMVGLIISQQDNNKTLLACIQGGNSASDCRCAMVNCR